MIGRYLSIREIAEATGISRRVIQRRADRCGWPFITERHPGKPRRLYRIGDLPEEFQQSIYAAYGEDGLTPGTPGQRDRSRRQGAGGRTREAGLRIRRGVAVAMGVLAHAEAARRGRVPGPCAPARRAVDGGAGPRVLRRRKGGSRRKRASPPNRSRTGTTARTATAAQGCTPRRTARRP